MGNFFIVSEKDNCDNHMVKKRERKKSVKNYERKRKKKKEKGQK